MLGRTVGRGRWEGLSCLGTWDGLAPGTGWHLMPSVLQNRPSVITCASAGARNCNLSHCPIAHSGCAAPGPASYRRPPSAAASCDPVVEEHFRRSLGKNYKEPEPAPNSVSITGSVDDHFAKALGDTWLQIKAAKDGASSSPESASRRGQPASPSTHMVSHSHSPSVVS